MIPGIGFTEFEWKQKNSLQTFYMKITANCSVFLFKRMIVALSLNEDTENKRK